MSDSYLEETDCDFQKECQSLLRLLHILPFLGKFKRSNQENETKECRSILRDEASVYFNVTAVHV